ncbi:4Fe-4S binding protein [Lamprobacter modestohalophilus]|uniref:4Fe-4S binding protein n=1 Tax=Lamprobacter modestohalophilus TaxID=1064514 RepID=UPI002ADEED47|nr:4Fe-4S binding protein [Lamprobacter modestohalophilus]MEA1053028.1 4Fe-4S binding protein [Lamprobacter modestohalophilus]
MGHLLNDKSALVPLIDRLNRYPVGLVDSPRLRQILALLFDPREAEVAARFPLTEATRAELVERTGLPAAELDGILESMANKGLVMDLPVGHETYYLLVPGLIGFMEFSFMRDRGDLPQAELARLMSAYLREQGKDGQAGEFFGSRWPLTRALVYEDQIPVQSRITPWEDARQIIQDAEFHAVTLCFCRHKKAHEGKTCQQGAPVEEICMVLGEGARFLVRRGMAEPRSAEQMLAILDRARALGLTHITDNIREQPSFLCNCCRCCCELLAGVQMGFNEGIAKTPFLAEVDPERCDYCGACLRACNAKCIGLAEDARALPKDQRWAQVDPEVCLGCGACLQVCEQGALTLVPRAKRPRPPRDRNALFARILWDKGRLMPFIAEGLRRGVERLRRRR